MPDKSFLSDLMGKALSGKLSCMQKCLVLNKVTFVTASLFLKQLNPLYTGRLFTVIYWMSPFVILGVLGLFCHFYVASEQGLHCLPMTLLQVF